MRKILFNAALLTALTMPAAFAADYPSGYSKCANQDGTCTVKNAPNTVAYGIKDKWVYKYVTGSTIACTTAAFGSDPYPGTDKKCSYNTSTQITTTASSAATSTPTVTPTSKASSTSTPTPTTLVATATPTASSKATVTPTATTKATATPTAVAATATATPTSTGFIGFGGDTRGGLDGTVIKVTNLNDSGAGSLRAAIDATGARVIVFEVGGIISLKSYLKIKNPNITIAGQTAPSPGITLTHSGMSIETHDVVMQHIRVRMGDNGLAKKSGYEVDITTTGADTYNVVIDHCSVAWGTDENLSISGPRYDGQGKTSRKVTLSNNIIAEGLYDSTHSKGIHSMGTLVHDNVVDAAIIGNLYAHNNERNPWFKGSTTGVIVNNYIYNPGVWAIRLGYIAGEWAGYTLPNPPSVSIVGNVMQAGTNTPSTTAFIGTNTSTTDGGRAYMSDNLAWKADGTSATLKTSGIVSLSSKPSWPTGLVAKAASTVKASVLASAGARPKERDAVDARIVANIQAGTGSFVNSQTEVGGYPTATATARTLTVPSTGLEAWLKQMASALE